MIYSSLCGCIRFRMPVLATEEERVEILKTGHLVRITHLRAFPEHHAREHRDPVWRRDASR